MITDQPFDHVIVDEATAACPPDVVHAAGRPNGRGHARRLPAQGPIVDNDIEKIERLHAHYQLDCLTNLHLTDPVKAEQSRLCRDDRPVAIRQERARLANLVAYSGQPSAVQPHQCDIVVIDCDRLGSALNTTRRPHGGWAGTPPSAPWCPAPSPSTNHGRDATTGVVGPYNAQSKAARELLAESAARRTAKS